jgi:hypothetical protein
MPKKRVNCPDCGHRFTVQIGGVQAQAIGVTRSRNNPFQFSLTAPKEMMETEKFFKVSEDMLVTGGLSLFAGGLCAFCVGVFEPDYTIYAGIIGSLGSVTCAWWWLIDERYQRLRRMPKIAIQWAQEALPAKDESITGNVELTMDHRYRDGHTEAGRTIQYFGELPVDVERFNEWAQGALLGKSLAVPQWTPRAKLFSRPEYDKLLDKMRASEAIINLGSNKGNTLTSGGKRALTRHLLANGITPPSPETEDIFGQHLTGAKQGGTPLPRREKCVHSA